LAPALGIGHAGRHAPAGLVTTDATGNAASDFHPGADIAPDTPRLVSAGPARGRLAATDPAGDLAGARARTPGLG